MHNVNLRAIAFGILAVISLWALLSFFFTIDAGERGVVLRFGAVTRVVAEGIQWKLPFMEQVVKMSFRVQESTTKTEAASRDLQAVHTTIVSAANAQPLPSGRSANPVHTSRQPSPASAIGSRRSIARSSTISTATIVTVLIERRSPIASSANR